MAGPHIQDGKVMITVGTKTSRRGGKAVALREKDAGALCNGAVHPAVLHPGALP